MASNNVGGCRSRQSQLQNSSRIQVEEDLGLNEITEGGKAEVDAGDEVSFKTTSGRSRRSQGKLERGVLDIKVSTFTFGIGGECQLSISDAILKTDVKFKSDIKRGDCLSVNRKGRPNGENSIDES